MAKYTQDSHITSTEEVRDFFHHIVYDLDVNFHPDDDFADYVNRKDGTPTFTKEEAVLYNRLMDEAFKACNDEDAVYDIASELLRERLRI